MSENSVHAALVLHKQPKHLPKYREHNGHTGIEYTAFRVRGWVIKWPYAFRKYTQPSRLRIPSCWVGFDKRTNGHMHPRGILFCMNIVDIVVGLVLVKVHLYFGKVYCTTHHL